MREKGVDFIHIFGQEILNDRVGLADVMDNFEREKAKFSPNQKTSVCILISFTLLY